MAEGDRQPLGLAPPEAGRALAEEFDPPGSKSHAIRALVIAALQPQATMIGELPPGEDVRHGALAVEAFGAVDQARRGSLPAAGERGSSVWIRGRPPGRPGWVSPIQVGESGTLARFATAIVGLCGPTDREVRIEGGGTLYSRTSAPLFEALERAVVRLRLERLTPGWPVGVVAAEPVREVLIEAPVSSQEVSGLAIALAAHPDPALLRVVGPTPSRPYFAMTRRVLEVFGVEIGLEDSREGMQVHLQGPPVAPPGGVRIEADASLAAVGLAAACLCGRSLLARHLFEDSIQGDVRIAGHLAEFGCFTRFEEDGLLCGGAPVRGAEIDLSGEPDLAPVLASVAAHAAVYVGASSTLTGLGTLSGKESNRVAVLAEGLRAIGLEVRTARDRLVLGPGGSDPGGPIRLDPRGDHRMAFAFALLGLVRNGVFVAEPGCVAKTWPDFWHDMGRAGLRVVPWPPFAG